MTLTTLGEMQDGDHFLLPGRKPGVAAGKLIRIGLGSASVHIPKVDGEGWDSITIALGTQVEPCSPELYNQQGYGEKGTGGRVRNRSEVKRPVDIVWGMCRDMPGATRNEIVDACVALGVNINTARTQYYKWRKTNA